MDRILCSTLIPLMIFLAAQTADGVTTIQDIKAGGYESNPLVAPFAKTPTSLVAAGAAFDGIRLVAEDMTKTSCRNKNIINYVLTGIHLTAAISNRNVLKGLQQPTLTIFQVKF